MENYYQKRKQIFLNMSFYLIIFIVYNSLHIDLLSCEKLKNYTFKFKNIPQSHCPLGFLSIIPEEIKVM